MENTELIQYRQQLLERLESAAKEFCAACCDVKDPYTVVEGDAWNVHQITAHVRDVDAHVYGMRIRKTVEEDYPQFPNFDGDSWVNDHYYRDEPLVKIVREFEESIVHLVDWLRRLSPAAWSRLSRHDIYGELTMQTWVERALAHIAEHLATVKKA